MEWVEMTGRTVEEAVEAALDRLGVAETDAEVVVVEEPRSGMFGLRRSDARIRVRVRPVQPWAKRPSRRSSTGSGGGERGNRRQGGPQDGSARKADGPQGDGTRPKSGRASGPRTNPAQARQAKGKGPAQNGSQSSRAGSEQAEGQELDASANAGVDRDPRTGGRQRSRSRGRGGRGRSSRDRSDVTGNSQGPGDEGGPPKEGRMSIETQQELAAGFVSEVVARFGIEATTQVRLTEDDGIFVSVEGDNLGLLVGPKGATVEALQELTRTVVQRHTEEHTSRIVVDVGGYRERRTAALRQFVVEAAADVRRTGLPEALEPMSPSDRKVVHDTVNGLEDLETTSEGVEPHRYVVIRPAQPPDSSVNSGETSDQPGEPADLR